MTTNSYHTPQFEQALINSSDSSRKPDEKIQLAYDAAIGEESKQDLRQSYIDLNDDDVIYKGKKAFSPIIGPSSKD